MTTKVAVSAIRTDGGTQSRAGTTGPVVYEYAEQMQMGVEFPDIVIYHDGENYWLADGFHRVAAAKRAELLTINADVRQGTQRDAVLHSVGANAAHGLQRTNQDKERAVTVLLMDEEWAKWSDREIARRAGVSAPMVGRVRGQLKATVNHLQSTDERLGGDGRLINTAGINQGRHWGLSNGMPFWSKVEKYGLDKSNILDRIQTGAAALTDLTCDKDEAFTLLDQFAVEALEARFPVDSYVLHIAVGRVGIVQRYTPTALYVYDFHENQTGLLWAADGLRLATPEESGNYKVYGRITKPDTQQPAARTFGPAALTFNPGDHVQTRTGRRGVVVSVDGRVVLVECNDGAAPRPHNAETLKHVMPKHPLKLAVGTAVTVDKADGILGVIVANDDPRFPGRVCVTRPNPNGGSNMTHWIKKDRMFVHLGKDKQVAYLLPVVDQPAVSLGYGDSVTVEGAHFPGMVHEVDNPDYPGMVCVVTPYVNGTGFSSEWVDENKVTLIAKAQVPPPAAPVKPAPAPELPPRPWKREATGLVVDANGDTVAVFYFTNTELVQWFIEAINTMPEQNVAG